MSDSLEYRGNSQLLVSRRTFLYGAAVAGTAAALSGVAGCNVIANDDEISYLEVPESALVTLNDYEALESYEGHVQQIGQSDLPYGTLLWANDDNVAACLVPTSVGAPLVQVGLLLLDSGNVNIVLDRAVGFAEHYEVYDVRASSSGLIWTEANVLKGTWRIYMAQLAGGNMNGGPALMEEGDSTYETPMLAVAATRAYWQVIPKQPNDAGLPSRLMAATFGKNDAACIFENARRMGTPPYSSINSVTITPRLDRSGSFYQLTNIDADTDKVLDTMTLPGGMKPLEAGYGQNGFMFSFADIYNYGGGISNLGTYTPVKLPSGGDYSGVKWFGFARTPTAAPAWCNDLLVVKSTYSVCGVNLNEGTYFAIDVENGADNYGDYLATSGVHKNFVTYCNIDHQPIGAAAIHTCRVKTWTTLG